MHRKSKFSGWKLCADSLCMWAVCSPALSYAVQQIRDRLYSVSDRAYNTMFLVTSVGVIAVDARPS